MDATLSVKDIKDGWLNHAMINWLKLRKPTPQLQEYIDERFETCMACPHMIARVKRKWRSCGKCGCAFPALIFAYDKRCPDRRWDAIPARVRTNA